MARNTKNSKVMDPSPGPKPPAFQGGFHPAANNPQSSKGMDTKAPNAKVDPMRPDSKYGPRAMLTPVKPGKNDMNANPR